MKLDLKTLIRRTIEKAGFNVSRVSENPRHNLLGLRNIPIRTIFDVGANDGGFARIAREHFPPATLYCFEPIPEAFRKLSDWAKSQPNVVTVPLALGERTECVEMNLHTDHPASSSMLNTTRRAIELYPFKSKQMKIQVSSDRLDNYVNSLDAKLVPEVLLKLDVQGFEGAVLRGGTDLLEKTRVCLVEVCLESLYVGQSTFKDVLLLLDKAGLSYAGNLNQAYDDCGNVIYLDAVFTR